MQIKSKEQTYLPPMTPYVRYSKYGLGTKALATMPMVMRREPTTVETHTPIFDTKTPVSMPGGVICINDKR